jgi:transcriptional regulator with GAF, ATPase, and Fis domain
MRPAVLRIGGRPGPCVIAATNRACGRRRQLRPDLCYRLSSPCTSALRGGAGSWCLSPLVGGCRDMGIAEKPISPDAVDALLRYHWPGNVRELQNLVERVLVLSEGPAIRIDDLPVDVRGSNGWTPASMREAVLGGHKSLGLAVDEFERDLILEALRRTEFNQTRAAGRLGTTRRILKYRMDKLGIDAPERNGGDAPHRNGTIRPAP